MILYRCVARKSAVKNVASFRRCRNYTTSTASSMEPYINLDKLESVAVKLPLKTGGINVQYFDSATFFRKDQQTLARHTEAPTIIASHGTPGSHNDFKYMAPNLIASGYRVIAINWPGFGFTDSPTSPDEFDHTNIERAQLMTCFVKSLHIKKIDLIIGHSAGCYPLPLFFVENPGLCSAAIFVNPGGSTPHKGIRPYWIVKLLARLLHTFVAPVINYFLYFVTTRFFKMRINEVKQAGTMTRVIANIDFIYLNAVLLSLKQSKTPPIVLMCGRKDHLVEIDKSLEYAEKLGCSEYGGIFNVENGAELEKFKGNIFPSSGRLYRHCAVVFAHGTHFLQKMEAEAICKLSSEILESNKLAVT